MPRSWLSPFLLPAGIGAGSEIAYPQACVSQRFCESAFKILLASCFRLLSMMLSVLFCRFRSVMRGMVQVSLCGVRVVSCRFVIA
jgi:hypothetical protein